MFEDLFASLNKCLYMDYDGQRRAEYFFERIVVLFGLIGLIVGYLFQQFSYTFYSLITGFVLSFLISVPPWPMYRRKPLKWQKHIPFDYDGDSDKPSGKVVEQPHSKQTSKASKNKSKNN